MQKFSKIFKKWGLLKLINFNFTININKTKFKIPVIYQLGLNHFRDPNRELWLDDIIEKILVNKPGTFIDVGVHIGQTLLKVKSINANTDYLGFEPNQLCCFYVEELIKANNFQDCKIIPVGISKKADLLKLFMKNEDGSSSSIIEDFRDKSYYSSEKYVPVFEGDYLLKIIDIDAISIIKIDVEGAELEVIQGLTSSIKQYQPYIICEVLPVYDESTELGKLRKERQENLVNLLIQAEYKIFRIIDKGKLVPLENFEIHSDLSLCEYIFLPKNETNYFLDIYQNK